MKRPLILSFCLLIAWQAFSQIPDIPSPTSTMKGGIISYLAVADNSAVIYSGKEEQTYPTNISNHPYYVSDQYQQGTLSFDGVEYHGVSMRLNVASEELIVSLPGRFFNVIVPRDRLDYAILNSYPLFYNGYAVKENSLPEGYFLLIHKGNNSVLRRETAFLSEQITGRSLNRFFAKKVRYYIYKDGQYHSVDSKGALLKLFKNQKKELNRFIKQQNLNFRNSTEYAIVSVVEYYEKLIQTS